MKKIKDYIKYTTRHNAFYQKYIMEKVKSFKFFIKNLRYYFKYYNFSKDAIDDQNIVYFIIDPKIPHPGLTDRINSAVCIKYIAEINGFDFKMIFETPFNLKDYFGEKKVNWIADNNELSFSLRNSRVIGYKGKGKLPSLKKKIKQYHIYSYNGNNILLENNIPNNAQIWSRTFNDLFTPTEKVSELIAKQKLPAKSYVAAHLRFVNALEQFEEGFYNTLDEEKAQQLIDKCLNALQKIKENNPNKNILIFSDSAKFLSIAKKEGYHVLEGKVGHVADKKGDDFVTLKTFLDFMMMSRANRVYRIYSPQMYRSAFSYYAALAGGDLSEEVQID